MPDNENTTMKDIENDDDEIILDPNAGFTRTYDYRPYSQFTIKAYLGEAGYRLDQVGGYKCNRHPGYKQHYDVVRISTGETVQQWVTLDDMRYVLARADCPLPPPPRHSGAVRFLKAVEEIQRERESNGIHPRSLMKEKFFK